MSVIEDFIVASNSAGNLEELFSYLCTAVGYFGISSAAYFLVNDHQSLNLKGNTCVVSSYPKKWMNYYVQNNLLRHDPLLHRCFSTSNAFSWRQLNAPNLPKPSAHFVDAIYNFGILDAVGIPIHGPNSELACIGLAASSKIDPDPNFLGKVQALGTQFHIAFGRMAGKPSVFSPLDLTERERDILMWSAEGKSTYSIGEILSISENTVKYHLKNIYRKLNVTDRIQAVIKAIFLGLINPPKVSPQLPE